ncbi:minor tail protein [Mycobacterium phage Mendokysei]|uniref:Minor tail protein n=1 Tax=Mycobacterium phage Mendokysei TaxID=2099637 RepID=A0A2P1CG86_9CAUD|nr:minor tail protein [Mycobacterium phage Mendokysei]AVJ50236.1 minor tail protein [Mycobacterium phage Mendokysei]
MTYQTLMSVLELSRGSVWKPAPGLPPYLMAAPGQPWPAGSDAWVVFTDTSGSEIARIDADTVTAEQIQFVADSSVVDRIPAGANFELFVGTDDGPVKIRYGRVIRREVEYPDSPARQYQSSALQFTDPFPTLGLRSNWQQVLGRTKVTSLTPLPNGVGPGLVLLGDARSAIRWDQEMNSDTCRVKVRLVNKYNSGWPNDYAGLFIIVCADQRMTTGLGVKFYAGQQGVGVQLFTLNGGPINATARTGLIPHALPANGDFTLYYDHSVDRLTVAAGDDPTPIAYWSDDDHMLPHGPGYRHFGAAWHNSTLNQGIYLTYISAKDDV